MPLQDAYILHSTLFLLLLPGAQRHRPRPTNHSPFRFPPLSPHCGRYRYRALPPYTIRGKL
eukprot:scaffold249724_cov44-Tisochrysis_lutea.AAC.2